MSGAAKPNSVGFATAQKFEEHDTGHGHPERPQRLVGIRNALEARDLLDRLTPLWFEPCQRESLLAVHTAAYLQIAQSDIESGKRTLSTGDTNVCPASWDLALLAAGAACSAVDAVCGREVDYAFAALRPPGHHATADRGMGFCVLNNVAIAARYAQRKYALERAMIIDWDVHHGNGTQDIFYEDPTVLFFSTHQWPLYPGSGDADETGRGSGQGTTINVPLPEGSGRAAVLGAFESKLLPAVDKFQPHIVFVSAGFDSRTGDPLGGFQLTDHDFFDLTAMVMDIAERHAAGRLVSLLEGGYSISGLSSAVCAHVSALLGDGSSDS